jgi:putative transposase
LVGISRSGFYYEAVPESQGNLALMRRLDELHLEHPAYGSRRLTVLLQREGREVNRKRVARLLELMGKVSHTGHIPTFKRVAGVDG